MDLTPGEKAVLGQIRMLYAASARTDQQMKALTMQWAPTHSESYRKAYVALVAKRLIDDNGSQVFRITEAGLRAIGVAPRPPVAPVVSAARAHPVSSPVQARPEPSRGILRRAFGLLRGRA